MQDNLSGRFEEKELEECVQDLLNHLIVFLLCSQKILEHLDQVRGCDMLCDLVISGDGCYQHDAFKHDIVFGITVHKVVMKELDEICAMHDFIPLVGVNVDHCSEELNLQVSVFTAMLSHDNVLLKVSLECLQG